MALEDVEASGLEALEDFCVRPLGLTVAAWMSHRGEADLDAKLFTVGSEDAAGELLAVVSDDAVGYAEAADQAPDEFHRGPCWYGAHWFNLGPLSELVDGHEEETVAPLRLREGAQNVQPPDRERPGERDGLESQRRLMDLLGVVLAGVA